MGWMFELELGFFLVASQLEFFFMGVLWVFMGMCWRWFWLIDEEAVKWGGQVGD